ncbi:unnamed protein product [Mytilus edulis]|uniref:ZMYM2-like/QRICH1 C-terminal domain-containing protein n=1 Tax=Mytilus edulis TaxID=6550 RepID=A0A8S3PSW4_MYTED|nr:unnamed protein product [Mytilus edulis]
MSDEVANFNLLWSPMNLLQDEQDVNPDIDEDLENVLIQIDMLADQGSTEVCPEYSLETNTTETTNTCIATVPTVPDTTHENMELEDKQFDEEFLHLDDNGVQNFLDKQQNKNTAKKSFYDLALVTRFLKKKKETREIQTIPVVELDSLLSNFVLTVRKKDGQEYEPSTIRGFISSVERKLRRHKYGHSIMGDDNDESFHLTRETLKAKQKLLKQKGKGNKPKRAQPLTDEEIAMLFDKNVLGDNSPKALLNTVWLNNCVQFGLRGVSEHYSLRWGDVTLNTASDGTKYLELNERQTKTRTGANVADVREVSPKIYGTNGDHDPIKYYEIYKSKRPQNFCDAEDPFYLAPRTISLADTRSEIWFLRQKIGERKMGAIVKSMKIEGGLDENKRLTNHSARKYLVQKLRSNEIPDTDIMQISGHKNVNSINSYSSISENKQRKISHLLSNTSSEESLTCHTSTGPNLPCTSASTVLPSLSQPVSQHNNLDMMAPSISSQTNMSSRINSMFYGATLHINSLNVYMDKPPQQ